MILDGCSSNCGAVCHVHVVPHVEGQFLMHDGDEIDFKVFLTIFLNRFHVTIIIITLFVQW